jgi:hypothetical protein
LPVLFAGVKKHNIRASTENVIVMFENIVCLLSYSDDHPLISTKLPILMDACFIETFQEQSNESIQRRQKQNKQKKKQRLKEKRVTKWRQSKSRSDKNMRRTRAQIKGDKLEKSAMKQKVKGTLLPVSH